MEEESEEWEYASYREGSKAGGEKAHVEQALLVSSLNGEETSGEALEDGQHEGFGHYRDVKGGPGGGCARSKNCRRQHEIWSKAGSGGPSIEQEAGKLWHEIKCGFMTIGQLGTENTTIGKAMAEHGELRRRKC